MVVTIRKTSVADAEALVALDCTLAVAGDGMVLALEQIRSVEEERARIDGVFRGMSAGNATLSVVAELEGRVIGSADLRQLGPKRVQHVGILSVGVDPLFRRRGVARALMVHLIEHAKLCGLVRLELYVREDNGKAHALYEGLGFHHEATRERFVLLDDGSFVGDRIYALMIDS